MYIFYYIFITNSIRGDVMANEQIVITRNDEGIELEVQFIDSKKKSFWYLFISIYLLSI